MTGAIRRERPFTMRLNANEYTLLSKLSVYLDLSLSQTIRLILMERVRKEGLTEEKCLEEKFIENAPT